MKCFKTKLHHAAAGCENMKKQNEQLEEINALLKKNNPL